MTDPKLWLAVAFFTFLIIFIKYFGSILIKALDNKSKDIAEEILAAKEMKKNAEILLEKAEKYYQESVKYSDDLIKQAEKESQNLITDSQKAVEDEINKKTALALERIKTEEALILREVKSHIITTATKTLVNNVSKNMQKKHHDHLLNQSAKDFEKIIH